MRVDRIKLMGFRNYDALTLEPDAGFNCIIGENAQGKTNLIEALFLLSFCRSHRTRKDAELIQWGADGAYAGISISNQGGSRKVEMKMRRGEPKKMELDGAPVKTAQMMEIFHTVMFSPEDLCLVKQGPEYRRRFLDMELCKLKPAYFHRLVSYNTALKQRNALLKLHESQPGYLEAYDRQLAGFGAKIMQARREFVEQVSSIAQELHYTISRQRETLNVIYAPDVSNDVQDIEEAILKALLQSAALDKRRGFTGAGPHRDDILLTLNGRDVRAYGSQGQQRTAALCLKLAEIAMFRRTIGEPPVLLLDDVLSELDVGRQNLLLENITDCQTFLTGTELASMRRGMKVYQCSGGRLELKMKG